MPAGSRRTVRRAANKKSSSDHKAKTLPVPPSLLSTIGPSFILLGLALGSGELILWPYLTATYGLGLIWGGLLGITLQFFLNTEAMRYTLVKGESIFVGFRKLSIFWPIWYIFSTFIPWSIPGFSSASASLLTTALGWPTGWSTAVTIAFLILTGVLLSSGKTLYQTMEFVQKSVILVLFPFLLILAFWLTQQSDWVATGWGLIGRGDGWWFFPPGIAIASFLGAFAYSGGGGNLNLAQSYYIKEKGFGMGAFRGKIASLFSTGGSQRLQVDGVEFARTSENHARWSAWWRLVNLEHVLVFWGLGLITILVLATLSYSLLYGTVNPEGITFVFQEAAVVGQRTWAVMQNFFLLAACIMLVTTQIGVLEAAARIISENFVLLFRHKEGERWNLSLIFYIVLWLQIGLGIVVVLAGWNEPRLLLTMGAVLNGAAMMVAFPLLLWMNSRHLPKVTRPGKLRASASLIGFAFFFLFFCMLMRDFM